MVHDNGIIDLYCTSLLALVDAAGAAAEIEEEVLFVRDMAKDGAIRRFLLDPFVKEEGKRRALDEIIGTRVHPVLLHFLCILAAQEDLSRLGAIVDETLSRLAARREEVEGDLVTARPLPAEKVAEIERESGKCLGKLVHLHVKVDDRLLGGQVVRVGDFVVDGTVERQLENARQALLGG